MKTRATRRGGSSPEASAAADAVQRELHRTFTPATVDEFREGTGYNPRQRVATAHRVLLTVVEAFLVGQTLSFASLRAIFVRRFGFVRSCPFQRRFKQESAVAFFRAALEYVVSSVVAAAKLELRGALAQFSDVRVYDGTGQRVPPRGGDALPACTRGRAGTKWVIGYSIKTGLIEHGTCGAETASETPLWRSLVPQLASGALYLLDLGFFERQLFQDAQIAGAHVLMRLKSNAKVRVVGQFSDKRHEAIPDWSLSYFLTSVPSRRRGTLLDLDVIWGRGRDAIELRLVGVFHTSHTVRWYLTTVPRDTLNAQQIVQAYRLRWLVELLFRELKQNTDLGRSFTADPHAVEALTYGAMIAHVLVRSIRIQAALANEIPLEQLRPLACLHVARAFARDLVDALASDSVAWNSVMRRVGAALSGVARELKPSRSRPRIALQLGAIGA